MIRKLTIVALSSLAITAIPATAQVSLDKLLQPTLRLKGNGQETLVNCPWEKKLTIQLSKEAPAAVVKCTDGGPGVNLEFERP